MLTVVPPTPTPTPTPTSSPPPTPTPAPSPTGPLDVLLPSPLPVDVEISYFDWITLVVTILGIVATVVVALIALEATNRADRAQADAQEAIQRAINGQIAAAEAQADAINAQTDVLRDALRGAQAASGSFDSGGPSVVWDVEPGTQSGFFFIVNRGNGFAFAVRVESVASRDHVEFTGPDRVYEMVEPGELLSIAVFPSDDTLPAMLIVVHWREESGESFRTVIALRLQ